jgi:hypothetical protein
MATILVRYILHKYFRKQLISYSTFVTIHHFAILLCTAVLPKASFLAGDPNIYFLIQRNPYVLKHLQARKQKDDL